MNFDVVKLDVWSSSGRFLLDDFECDLSYSV